MECLVCTKADPPCFVWAAVHTSSVNTALWVDVLAAAPRAGVLAAALRAERPAALRAGICGCGTEGRETCGVVSREMHTVLTAAMTLR